MGIGDDDRNDNGNRIGMRLGRATARRASRHVAIKVAIVSIPLIAAVIVGISIAGAFGLGAGNLSLTTNETSKYPSTNVIDSSCVTTGSSSGNNVEDSASANASGNASGITCQQAGTSNASGGSGGGQEYDAASDAQKRVADACKATDATGSGFCAAWVSHVYDAAKLPSPSGNACDMYYNYCTSSDRSDLKVGMIIAVPSVNNGTELGRMYGHVGIYVGDGIVMHCTEGSVHTDTLDDWIADFDGTNNTVKWGFGPGLP